jgi:Uma2 family endonuclease
MARRRYAAREAGMALLERTLVEDAIFETVDEIPPGTRYVPPHLLTVDEFYDMIDERSPAELDEGAIVMPSPVGLHHEDCFAFLLTLLRGFVNARELGQVLGSRFKSRLGPRTAREPDILFVSTARRHLVEKLEVNGAPDLVVEIINSDKGRSEALDKVPQYERAGVAELWLVDLLKRHVQKLLLVDGSFQAEILEEGGTLISMTIPGFGIPVAVLLSSPGHYPSELAILQQLLAEEGLD